jgi:hypothetical protein
MTAKFKRIRFSASSPFEHRHHIDRAMRAIAFEVRREGATASSEFAERPPHPNLLPLKGEKERRHFFMAHDVKPNPSLRNSRRRCPPGLCRDPTSL